MSYSEMAISKNQGIMDRICSEIEKAGFKTQRAVGHSKFKVDIAVINPYDEDEYLMGIMLDGDSYKQSSNTKDREVAQISVLKGLGWDLHRVWTMDWWDNKQKELDKLMSILVDKKQAAFDEAKAKGLIVDKVTAVVDQIPMAEDKVSPVEEEPVEVKSEDENPFTNEEHTEKIKEEPDQNEAVEKEPEKQPKVEHQGIDISFSNPYKTEDLPKVADKVEEKASPVSVAPEGEYKVVDYVEATLSITNMSTADYVLKDNMQIITDKLQQLIDAEAPISQERLVKRSLRSFEIGRSSAATVEATEKALKKTTSKSYKQNGIKFFWREDQDPDEYFVYRNDTGNSERRMPEEVCQHELKNAVCVALKSNKAMAKDDLVKETIRTMGFARSGSALVEAVERGIKYGIKTGEIIQNADKTYSMAE